MTARAALPDLSPLFDEAWALYRTRFPVLMAVMGAGALASLAALALPLAAVALFAGWGASWTQWAAAAAAGLTGALWLTGWFQAALMLALLDSQADFSAVCREAWSRIGPFTWSCVLYVLAVFGGLYFFVVPGLYLAAALAFAPFVCVAEKAGAVESLRRSLRYSQGRWWGVLGRLALAGAASSIPGLVPIAGPALSAAAAPFSLAVVAVVYRRAREDAPVEPGFWPLAALCSAPAGLAFACWLAWKSVEALRESWPALLETLRAYAASGTGLAP